jgi:hypothetical protein
MPPLAVLCSPATVIDKTRSSASAEPKLIGHLRQREADALIVSGSETDVGVLATVLDALDIGDRVIVARDAICSSSGTVRITFDSSDLPRPNTQPIWNNRLSGALMRACGRTERRRIRRGSEGWAESWRNYSIPMQMRPCAWCCSGLRPRPRF